MNYLINDYFNMKTIIKQAQDSYLIEDPIKRAERWIEEQKEKQRIEEENKILAPKADYTDRVLQAEGLITTTLIAKDFGLSARKLNDILNKEGIQYKQGRTWWHRCILSIRPPKCFSLGRQCNLSIKI